MSRPLTAISAAVGYSLCLAALAAGGACTDTELRCIAEDCQVKEKAVIDNVVHAQGKVCTRDPNTATYPYKVLLVVDTSESTKFTDKTAVNGRYKALLQVLNDPNYVNNPHIQFAIMSFATNPVAEQATFTSDHATLLLAAKALDDAHSLGTQGQTDYLQALQLATKIITDDANGASAAERAFTQYDVQWLSDGNPELNPDCSGTCDANDPTLLQHCAETLPKVHDATTDLIALSKTLGVYSIKLSTIFLDTGIFTTPCTPLFAVDPLQWATGASYLTDMSNVGHGTYQRYTDASQLKFSLNVQTIVRSFKQNSFFLVNYSRVVEGNQLLPDSDQDGISDNDESKQSTDPVKSHSDPTTLCSDMARLRSADNPQMCLNACTPGAISSLTGLAATFDEDGDTLLNCEESVLLSLPGLIDSDKDDITDDLEIRFGTNVLQPTNVKGLDNDQDGIEDIDEIFQGLNPLSAQPDRMLAYSYVPLQTATADANAGVSCYTFQVDNVQLAPTVASETSSKGDNKICLFLVQHTVDNPSGQPTISRACKTANMQVDANGLVTKTPADGVLQFDGGEFAVVMCPDKSCAPTASGVSIAGGTGGKSVGDRSGDGATSERAILRTEDEASGS